MIQLTDESVLQLSDLRKEYQEPAAVIQVLRGVTVNVRRGEIVVLMGPSGSGKTTMLQIAGCMRRATSGQVVVAGEDVSTADEARRLEARRKHLGFVFQNFQPYHITSQYNEVFEFGNDFRGFRLIGCRKTTGDQDSFRTKFLFYKIHKGLFH